VSRGSIDAMVHQPAKLWMGGGCWVGTLGSVIRKGGTGGVAVVRSSLNATLIALQGLGSSINGNPLCAVAVPGAIYSGLMTLAGVKRVQASKFEGLLDDFRC